MPAIEITYDRTKWETRLGGGATATAAIDNFLSDMTDFNSNALSTDNNITVSFTDSATNSFDFTWPSSPTIQSGFDFNVILTTDWGKAFLNIFYKYGLEFSNN